MYNFYWFRILKGNTMVAYRQSTVIRQERELRGWSRQYIAEKVGVDLATVGRWERGERIPHPHYRKMLCELFQKNTLELGIQKVIEPELPADERSAESVPEPFQLSLPTSGSAPTERLSIVQAWVTLAAFIAAITFFTLFIVNHLKWKAYNPL